MPDAGKLTTHPANIDGLAFQLAIMIAIYFLTYYESLFLKMILPGALKAISFGLMFLWGMISAVIIRFILKKLGLVRYIDNNLQRRITGTAVDYMIVATLMAVKVTAVWSNIVPITLMCLIAGVATLLFMLYFGRRNDEYSFERLVALYGMGTGTAASGLLLLRIVDPEFKTPVAAELGLCNIFLLAVIYVSFVMFPLPKLGMAVGLITVAATGVVALVLLKVFKLWGKPAW